MTVKMCIKRTQADMSSSANYPQQAKKPKKVLVVKVGPPSQRFRPYQSPPISRGGVTSLLGPKPMKNDGNGNNLVDRAAAVSVNELLALLGLFVAVKREPTEQHEAPLGQVAPAPPVAPKAKLGTKAFVVIMLHALKCTGCAENSCKKMKLVMKHYIQCTKLKEGGNCELCRQLLRVVAEHALYLCPSRIAGPKLPCPVPMCDVMRATVALKRSQQMTAPA